eukprot:4447158-Pleurochrysis_carterae.AAC.3
MRVVGLDFLRQSQQSDIASPQNGKRSWQGVHIRMCMRSQPSKPTVDASLLLSFAELGHDDLSVCDLRLGRDSNDLSIRSHCVLAEREFLPGFFLCSCSCELKRARLLSRGFFRAFGPACFCPSTLRHEHVSALASTFARPCMRGRVRSSTRR